MAFFPQWYVRASHFGACRRGELPERLLFGTLIDWEIVAREVGTGGQIAAGEEMAVVENAAGEIAAGENSVGERSASQEKQRTLWPLASASCVNCTCTYIHHLCM